MTVDGGFSYAWRGLTASALLVCLLTLVPLAQASPPDQTWIAGLYDDADHDDAVLAVTSSIATVQGPPVTTGEPLAIVVEVLATESKSPAVAALVAAPQTRAPPSA